LCSGQNHLRNRLLKLGEVGEKKAPKWSALNKFAGGGYVFRISLNWGYFEGAAPSGKEGGTEGAGLRYTRSVGKGRFPVLRGFLE